MAKVARVGDRCTGTCCCHDGCIQVSGFIRRGSDKFYSNGKKVARRFDLVVFSCGHTALIRKGSAKYTADGRLVARKGDPVTSNCISGIIVQGSNDHTSD